VLQGGGCPDVTHSCVQCKWWVDVSWSYPGLGHIQVHKWQTKNKAVLWPLKCPNALSFNPSQCESKVFWAPLPALPDSWAGAALPSRALWCGCAPASRLPPGYQDGGATSHNWVPIVGAIQSPASGSQFHLAACNPFSLSFHCMTAHCIPAAVGKIYGETILQCILQSIFCYLFVIHWANMNIRNCTGLAFNRITKSVHGCIKKNERLCTSRYFLGVHHSIEAPLKMPQSLRSS
jgi:hypothetical protein